MYISTYYSFKGGVGRTMALVNVAVDLAKRGRRVLIVDFDLEAPGLDTFPSLRTKRNSRGLVEYVLDYLETDQGPAVSDFVAESSVVENLLVMPSGAIDQGYSANFAQIDWPTLYEQRYGYLLFEDLRMQCEQDLYVDYMLVDSRTGFSDTGGICTRQLPDEVNLFFFPNEQNLRGLTKVVSDIRSEKENYREKSIKTNFVMSNVPDLDDEDDILVEMKQRFQKQLSMEEEPLVIHRYESLSLLNQVIFTLDRPKSRLAREYHTIAEQTVNANIADRDGAMHRIQEMSNESRRFRAKYLQSSDSLKGEILRIKELHANDGELLFELAEVASELDDLIYDSENLYQQAIEAGYKKDEAYLARARARFKTGDTAGANEDALVVLNSDATSLYLIIEAADFLDGSAAESLKDLPAVLALSEQERIRLAKRLLLTGKEDQCDAILVSVLDRINAAEEQKTEARKLLILRLISARKFSKAIDLLMFNYEGLDKLSIQDVFNFGIAKWGNEQKAPVEVFKRVLDLHEENSERIDDANYCQCLSLACWVVRDVSRAQEFAQKARLQARNEIRIFSCWRYRELRIPEFLVDVGEMEAMIRGDNTKQPEIFYQ